MTDQFIQRQLAAKNKTGRLVLQVHRSTITPGNRSLSHTDVRSGNFDAFGGRSLREEQYPGSRTGTGNRLIHDSRSRNSHNRQVRAAAPGQTLRFRRHIRRSADSR